jgi:hypothetical protein
MDSILKALAYVLMFVCVAVPPWNLFWWCVGYLLLWSSDWEHPPSFGDVILFPYQVVLVCIGTVGGLFRLFR